MSVLDYFSISKRMFLRALVLETFWEKKGLNGKLHLETSFITWTLIGEFKADKESEEELAIRNPLNGKLHLTQSFLSILEQTWEKLT